MDKEKLEALSAPIINIFQSIEEALIINLVRRLVKHGSLMEDGNYLAWQAEQFKQIPNINEETMKMIARRSGIMQETVEQMFLEAGIGVISEVDEMAEFLPTPEIDTADDAYMRQMASIYAMTSLDQLNVIAGNMLKQTTLAFQQQVTNITAQMAVGVKSFTQARNEALRRLANEGITAFTARNGAKWSPEAYISLIMRQSLTEMSNGVQDERIQKHGIDLVLISQHSGARPKCAKFQNRVFSLSGTHPRYKPLSSTSMGEPDGLFGINCGHYKIPYVEGYTNKPKKMNTMAENAETYKQSQQQRKIEREIRKAKLYENVAKETGDPEEIKRARATVHAKQAKMRQFLDETNRTRRRDREQIVR